MYAYQQPMGGLIGVDTYLLCKECLAVMKREGGSCARKGGM